MKSIIDIKWLAIFIIAMFFVAFNAKASATYTSPDSNTLCPSCGSCSYTSPAPDCYGYTPNGYGFDLTGSEIYGNCFILHFKIRECTCSDGTKQRDIYLEKIELQPDCSLNNSNLENIIAEAVRCLLFHAPWYFENNPNLLNPYNVTISMPSCWTYNVDGSLIPCLNNTCCKTNYTVTNTKDGTYITDKTKINPSNTACTGTTSNSCTYSCNSNDLPLGSLFQNDISSACTDICPSKQWQYNSFCWDYKIANSSSTWGLITAPTQLSVDASGSAINMSFSYKKCDDGTKYIKVDRVLTSSTFTGTTYDVLQVAVRNALKYAFTFFEDQLDQDGPPNGQYYTIVLPSCWTSLVFGDVKAFVPCSFSSCCTATYHITYDANYDPNNHWYNEISKFEYNSQYPGYENLICADNNNFNCNDKNGCNCVCEILFSGSYAQGIEHLAKIITNDNENTNRKENTKITNNNSYLSIKPNPVDDKVEITLTSDIQGITQLNISNAMGVTIFKNESNNKNNELKWELDTKSYSVGTYFINITINGTNILSDKFIISR